MRDRVVFFRTIHSHFALLTSTKSVSARRLTLKISSGEITHVATLSVLKFPTADGAQQMESILLDLHQQHLIEVQDAAIVNWPQGKKQPRTQQLHNMAGAGAMQGAFWGMLFGLIFFVPFFGLAVGAAMGALGGKMADYGISDE